MRLLLLAGANPRLETPMGVVSESGLFCPARRSYLSCMPLETSWNIARTGEATCEPTVAMRGSMAPYAV